MTDNLNEIRVTLKLISQKSDYIIKQVETINARVCRLEEGMADVNTDMQVASAARAETCPYKEKIEDIAKQQGQYGAIKKYKKETFGFYIAIIGLLVAIASYLFLYTTI